MAVCREKEKDPSNAASSTLQYEVSTELNGGAAVSRDRLMVHKSELAAH